MFLCHVGNLHYNRIPFRLDTAPETFQRALEGTPAWFPWKPCLFYLYRIIVLCKEVHTDIRHVDEILTDLGNAGVTFHLNKALFFTDVVESLRYVFGARRLTIDGMNTRSLREAHFRATGSSSGHSSAFVNSTAISCPVSLHSPRPLTRCSEMENRHL